MANVYTRESKLPRTVTLSDYGFKSRIEETIKRNYEEEEMPRLHSPSRRINPQPVGLVYQSPYNRFNQTFGIWNPNHMTRLIRSYDTLPHLRTTNFSCKHETDVIKSDTAITRKQPKIRYTRGTVQRDCFQWPAAVEKKFEGMVKTTRFGHTPRKKGLLTGIVPNALADFVPAQLKNQNLGMEGFGHKKKKHEASPIKQSKLPTIESNKKEPTKNLERLKPCRRGEKVVVLV